MSAEMKACPFCGGKPHSRTEIGLDGIGCFYWFECSTCCARSGEKLATETCPQFYEEVRDAWNHRTDLSQASVAAALEAAKQALNDMLGNTLMTPDQVNAVRGAVLRIRALITPAQHDTLAAYVAAEVAKARAEDADLLYNAWLGLRVLENIAKVKGLSGAADVTTPLLAEIEAAHPEFAPRSALRTQIGAKP